MIKREKKYKGFGKMKIKQIQEANLPHYSVPVFDEKQLNDSEVFQEMEKAINEEMKKEAKNSDIYILCEMAKKYLETMERSKERENIVAEFKDYDEIGTLTVGDKTIKCYFGDIEKHKILVGNEFITKSVVKLIEV